VEGTGKVGQNKALTNKVMKFSIVIKEYRGDNIPRMPTTNISQSQVSAF
jgi:hypothetical protein